MGRCGKAMSRAIVAISWEKVRTAWRVSLSTVLVSYIAVHGMAPLQAQEIDPEWPCIQRLIVEVSPAVMWPVPIDETIADNWKKDKQMRVLSERLGDLEEFSDDERALIAEFATNLPDDNKEARLSELVSGIVTVTNRVRRDYIRGIKRYTRQQIAISGQIEDSLNRLSTLEDDNSDAGNTERNEITETLRWHERVYDQREQAIGLLCEQPVELEQQLSDVLRDVAQYLP